MEDHDLDVDALKAIALSSLAKKAKDTGKFPKKAPQTEDDLAALRAAALQSKVKKGTQFSSSLTDTEISNSLTATPSKFQRGDCDSASDASGLSLLEEDTRLSGEEEEEPEISQSASPPNAEVQAIPELLEDGVDITEFDDEDLILEDEPVKSKSTDNQNSKRKTVSNAVLTRIDKHKRLPPRRLRSRSRSPRLRRSRSPLSRRQPRSPVYNASRDSPSKNSAHKYAKPDRSVRAEARVRSHSPNGRRTNSNTDINKTSQNMRSEDNGAANIISNTRAVATPQPPNPLDNPLLTEEERDTLVKRKEKFLKKKVSSTKKTIKLKTKKKTGVTKRLGVKKPKVIKVKSQSPEIVETVALDTEDRSQSIEAEPQPQITPKPTVKKGILERLGGYADLPGEADPARAKKKRRQVSIEHSVSSDEDSVLSGSRSSTAFSTDQPIFARHKILTETPREPSRPSEIVTRKISASKRNIWTNRPVAADESVDNTQTGMGDARLRVGERESKSRPESRSSRSARPLCSSSNHISRHSNSQESLSKNRSEEELDERIKKIKERNAKLEERQKQIELEKRMFS